MSGTGGYPGGGWNPGNWMTWLYTGSPTASDEVMNAAFNGSGDYYLEAAGLTHQALQNIATVDPSFLAMATSGLLILLEGQELHAQVMANASAAPQQVNVPTPGGNIPVPANILPEELAVVLGANPAGPPPGAMIAGGALVIPGGNAPPPPPQNWGQAVTIFIRDYGPLIIGTTAATSGMVAMALDGGDGGNLQLDSADSWGNAATLEDHFNRHGPDFGATSAEDYAQQASDFLQNSQDNGFPTKIDPKGVIRIFDPVTESFGSFNPDGTAKTFYVPDPAQHGYPTNLDYWNAQPGTTPWKP